jgi:hypothetical protein
MFFCFYFYNNISSSENLAVTMEMNNEAIRYIEALREQ